MWINGVLRWFTNSCQREQEIRNYNLQHNGSSYYNDRQRLNCDGIIALNLNIFLASAENLIVIEMTVCIICIIITIVLLFQTLNK